MIRSFGSFFENHCFGEKPGSIHRQSGSEGIGVERVTQGAENAQSVADEIRGFLGHQAVSGQFAAGNADEIFKTVRPVIYQRHITADFPIIVPG